MLGFVYVLSDDGLEFREKSEKRDLEFLEIHKDVCFLFYFDIRISITLQQIELVGK